ncbi:unnamed protein product [Pseudo-nitzschia multistriata]|uniref:Phosphagen kinase C-terminal domain-containing protein n=1 Tax=Pseudo-nitzschia multistriata TaxID=183589 RepID=A0A448ZHD1_9STRA|nr:unnamed protein product [Pseudo-nitzschia multistriata]
MPSAGNLAGHPALARAVSGAMAAAACGKAWALSSGESGERAPTGLSRPPLAPRWVSSCEAEPKADPSFPDFSRFGSGSYLRRYLTPAVYASLRDKTTRHGVTLEDLIRSGVSLPWGARPPRGTGVYAGDEESYHVFADLLVPIVEDYHRYHFADKEAGVGIGRGSGSGSASTSTHSRKTNNHQDDDDDRRVTAVSPAMVLEDGPMYGRNSRKSGMMLRRQFTNLNKNAVLKQVLDPTGDYILQTRMRVARSIKGFPFSPVIGRAQRREVEALFREMADEDWNSECDDHPGGDGLDEDDDDEDFGFGFGTIVNQHGGLRNGKYLRVMDMTNEQHDDLIARHVLFHDPDEYNISVGIGRDWPDARGIYVNSSSSNRNHNGSGNHNTTNHHHDTPDLMIWLNKEDHLRVIATSNGGDLLAVFGRLSEALTQIEQSLHKRGHAFARHPRYGFVNTSPENLGTALRASVYIKLYRLGQQPGFADLLDRLRLETSSRFEATGPGGGYTGVFDVANAERLGQSEVQLINTMINGVGRLIELEKRLERGEAVDLEEVR